MTIDTDDDLALSTLLSVKAELFPDLDEQLVRQCYAIQKKHQFSDDRNQSSVAIEKLIDHAVDAAATSESA